MPKDLKISSLQDLDEKNWTFRYRFIKQNYEDLYKIFAENSNTKEFTQSRRATFILILVPSFVNLYYSFVNRTSIFKNSIRISAILACGFNFGYQIFTDLNEVGKTDTPAGNKIKKLWQNIAYSEPSAPDFGKETLKIIRERKRKENQHQE